MKSALDRIAVITGASGGIGSAVTRALAAESSTVCLVGRDMARLNGVAQSARELGADALPLHADLTVDADIEQLSQLLRARFDGIDVLVHSAGSYARGPLQDASADQFDSLYRANVRAPFTLTKALVPLLRARHGMVVFINSSAGLNANADIAQYSSAQHARRALADGLRQEVNADGIRVLSVFLGRTATPLLEHVYASEGWEYRPELLLQPEDVASLVRSVVNLSPTAEVTDIRIRPAIKSY